MKNCRPDHDDLPFVFCKRFRSGDDKIWSEPIHWNSYAQPGIEIIERRLAKQHEWISVGKADRIFKPPNRIKGIYGPVSTFGHCNETTLGTQSFGKPGVYLIGIKLGPDR